MLLRRNFPRNQLSLHAWSVCCAVPVRAGLLWFNREGLGIWDLSLADAWPPQQSSAGDSDQPRLPSTLGLASARPHVGSHDWLLRAGAFALPKQPTAEEGGYLGHFHGNDLRSYTWSDAATLPDPLSGADAFGNVLNLERGSRRWTACMFSRC